MTSVFRQLLSRELVAILVMLAVLLARWLRRNAPKRLSMLLWAVVCFRLLCPVSISAPVSLVPQKTAELSEAVARAPESHELENLLLGPSAAVFPEDMAAQSARTPRQWRLLIFELTALVWVIGAAGLLLWQLGKLWRLRRTLRGAQMQEDGVFAVEGLQTAFVLGLLRPRIFLPAGLSAQQRHDVLLHERTHIKRLDPLWKLLALLCLCIHWFDPLVWLCCGLFGRDMELACDEDATRTLDMQARCDYAQTLLTLSGPRMSMTLFPAFSQPEPERRIRRVLSWKKPGKLLCALALVLVVLLGVGLLVNPSSKDSIFSQRYKISACLYEHPSFNSVYREDLFSSFALSENHTFYTQEADGSFNESGGVQEISLSKEELLALFEPDWLAADVRAQLMRTTAVWRAQGATGQNPFFLFLRSGKSLLLAVGYGLGSDAPFVRWLFELEPDTTVFTTQELTALIRKSNNLNDWETIQIYSVYESESFPGLLFAAYDGAKNGVAVFSYDGAMPGYYIRMLTTSSRQDTFYSESSTWYDLGKSFSIITSHHENAAEVRASWSGEALTAPITSCPAMVILEWPGAFPLNSDSEPDIRFYDAAGHEIPRE